MRRMLFRVGVLLPAALARGGLGGGRYGIEHDHVWSYDRFCSNGDRCKRLDHRRLLVHTGATCWDQRDADPTVDYGERAEWLRMHLRRLQPRAACSILRQKGRLAEWPTRQCVRRG